MSLKERNTPAIHDNVVVLERPREVDAEALLRRSAIVGHMATIL